VLEINLKPAMISYTSFAMQNSMSWVTVSVLASLDRSPVVSIQYYQIGIYCFSLIMQYLGARAKTGCLEIRIRHAYQQTGGAVS
jgi:hypothetical protein